MAPIKPEIGTNGSETRSPMRADDRAVIEAVDHAARHGKLIFGLCIAGAIIGAAYTFFVPPRWLIRARLFVTIPEQAPVTGGLAAMLGTPSNPYAGALAGLLSSQKTLDAVSKATDYDLEKLRLRYNVELEKESSQIIIGLEHPDKEKGLYGVRTAIWNLTNLGQNLDISKATREAKEYSKAVKHAQEQLDAAQQKLLAYQRVARTVPDPEKPFLATAYIKNYQDLRAELGAVDAELDSARKAANQVRTLSADVPSGSLTAEAARQELGKKQIELAQAKALLQPNSPEVLALERQVNEIRQAVQTEVSNFLKSVEAGTDPKIAELEAKRRVLQWQVADAQKYANSAPSEAVQYQQLISDVQIASKLVETVSTQYEQAKIQSEVEQVRWSVLDRPYVEPEPVNKSYPRNIALGVLVGLVTSLGIVWFKRNG